MLLPIALMLASIVALPASDNRIAVHVRAGIARPQPDGFVEPVPKEFADSARDIAAQLAKNKRVRLVRSDAEADVVLKVIDRRIESAANGGSIATLAGNSIVTVPTGDSWRVVRVRLAAGSFSKDYVGALNWAASTWSSTAKNISQQVTKWIEANAETLIAHRAETR